MFRTLRRWFSTEETKQLAQEYEILCDKLSDMGHKVEGYGMKLESRRQRSARAAWMRW
jgi:hypothetical protein